MEPSSDFYTLKGYSLMENTQVTAAMEDYLEMICRLSADKAPVRINDLARHLNVRPSSASKMAANLQELGLIDFPKYGLITLTDKGIDTGEYLLYRHNLLNDFFCQINHSLDELEQVEKVEHFLTPRTVENIRLFMEKYCKTER